jgi:hypothetical protein
MTNVALIDVLTSLILTCLTGLEDADRVAINTGPEGEAQDFYPYDECVALALQIVEQHRELVLHIFYPNHPKEDLSKKSTSEDRRIAIRLAELAQAFAVPIYLSVLQHVPYHPTHGGYESIFPHYDDELKLIVRGQAIMLSWSEGCLPGRSRRPMFGY